MWEAHELRQFLSLIEPHRLGAAFHVSSHTGVRRGELLGRRWMDIDIDASRLSVRQAVVSVAYNLQLSDVKTSNGRRTIGLAAGTVAVLEARRSRRDEEHRMLGTLRRADELVFSHADATPTHPDVLSQIFDRAVAR